MGRPLPLWVWPRSLFGQNHCPPHRHCLAKQCPPLRRRHLLHLGQTVRHRRRPKSLSQPLCGWANLRKHGPATGVVRPTGQRAAPTSITREFLKAKLEALAPRHVPTKSLWCPRQRNWAGKSTKNAPLITLYHLAIYVCLYCTPNQVRP